MTQPPNDGGWNGPQGTGQPWDPASGQPPFPPAGPQFPPGQQYPPGQQFPPAQQFPPGQQPYQPGPPPGYGPPPGGFGPQWGPPAGPPPTPWWRRGWVIGLTAAVVVIIVAVVATITLVALSDKDSEPSDTVTAYLEALSSNDAAKALGTMKAPGNTKLLTDDILKRQQAKAKISAITIVSTDTLLSDRAVVKATYNFGQRNADVDFRLTKSGDDWKLETGAVELDLSTSSLERNQPTLFGVDVSADSKAYVFPGPLEWGTANKYIAATDEKADDWPLGPDESYYPQLDFDISKEGNTAASVAVTAYLQYCSQSRQTDAAVDKPGCGQQVFAFDAIPGTVTWSDPRSMELSSIKLRYSAYSDADAIAVSGSVPWQATYRSSREPAPVTRSATDYLSGKVDLSKNPPQFAPN